MFLAKGAKGQRREEREGGGVMANLVVAFGAKVPGPFLRRVVEICEELGIDASWLMACMAFETGERFTASVKNPQSSATGLIQFMEATARSMGTTTAQLAAMSELEQLEYVRRYFLPWKGRLKTLADVYMVILWPAAVGKPEDFVLFARTNSKRRRAYLVNAGLDADKDGDVDKREASAKVAAKLVRGLQRGFRAEIEV
jgi:hypothetical protein